MERADEIDDAPKLREYVVVIRVGQMGNAKVPAREVRFAEPAQSPELAIKAVMSDRMIQLCFQGLIEPVGVREVGGMMLWIGACCGCGSSVFSTERSSKGRANLLCEDCGPDCLPPSASEFEKSQRMWLGDSLEEKGE
jgi:hypothetical protein